MKKSNWIIFGILAATSIFFLTMWYVLGFHLIDSPVDLVITIVWWLVIIGCITLIHQVEKKRQEKLEQGLN